MQRFSYKAKNISGKYISGLVEARDYKEAANLLRERKLFIIRLSVEAKDFFKKFNDNFSKVSYNDVVNLTRQLSTMVTAGLTLSESLAILSAQIKKPALLKLVVTIEQEVQGGKSFASVIDKYPHIFTSVYRSLIKAGEASGKLDEVLTRLADNMEKTRDFRSKTKGAMVYPVMVMVAMIMVMFVLMTFVVPKLTEMYKSFDTALPLPTQILIAISDFFARFWYLVIGGSVSAVFLFLKWKKSKAGSRIWDKIVLSLPIFGNLIKESTLVEVTRTLSILISAGIPILDAIDISEGAVDNVWYKDALKQVEESVQNGLPLGVPFSENPIFPPILGQMVGVGEETGKLDDALIKLSNYFEKESDNAMKAMLTAIEPLMVVVLGLGVGFIVIAIMLPIYNLTSQF